MVQLAKLAVGIEKKVLDITAESNVRDRLLEMGLAPGRVIKILHALPFNGPVVVQSGPITLALRFNEAEKIWVEE